MDRVQRASTTGLLTCSLLASLDASVGLDDRGWAVGLLCSAGLVLALGRALSWGRIESLGPADRVTLARAVLACGAAGLVGGSFGGHAAVPALVALSAVALVLDGVDGQVARRTGTVSRFGAAFDMEVDAFLLLVLSVYVATSAGSWVLLVGGARYGLLAGTWALPWLRRPTPPRYWGKVVAATQGVVLVVAATGVVPRHVMDVLLLAGLGLLAESFGRQVWWLWRHRAPAAALVMPGQELAS